MPSRHNPWPAVVGIAGFVIAAMIGVWLVLAMLGGFSAAGVSGLVIAIIAWCAIGAFYIWRSPCRAIKDRDQIIVMSLSGRTVLSARVADVAWAELSDGSILLRSIKHRWMGMWLPRTLSANSEELGLLPERRMLTVPILWRAVPVLSKVRPAGLFFLGVALVFATMRLLVG